MPTPATTPNLVSSTSSSSTLPDLPSRPSPTRRPSPIPITINGTTITPETPSSPNSSTSNYILIQSVARLTLAQKETLRKLEVVVHEYVSENTYLCHFLPNDLRPVLQKEWVVWAGVFDCAFVVQSVIRRKFGVGIGNGVTSASTARSPLLVDVFLHQKSTQSLQEIRQYIKTQKYKLIDLPAATDGYIRLSVQAPRDLQELAKVDSIRSIEPVYGCVEDNDKARQIVRLHDKFLGGFGWV